MQCSSVEWHARPEEIRHDLRQDSRDSLREPTLFRGQTSLNEAKLSWKQGVAALVRGMNHAYLSNRRVSASRGSQRVLLQSCPKNRAMDTQSLRLLALALTVQTLERMTLKFSGIAQRIEPRP